MSWQKEIDELRHREELAKKMGGEERIQRQHDNARLTVRERIDALVDPGSFHEIGALAGKASYDDAGNLNDFTPSNFVLGTARINGRRVVIGGDDFTVRGGAADAKVGNKSGYGEQYALEMRQPLVRLIDGSGGGGSVKTLEMKGYSYIPQLPGVETTMKLMGHVPVVCACMGSVAGLGAVRATISHFSLMVKDSSQLFVAGPPIVERGFGRPIGKNELGGSHIHTQGSGAIDNEVETEQEAFITISRFLSYLPVVNLVDNPGFLIGTQAEEEGTVRLGSRALMACLQATIPWVSIIIRRCYGVAGAGHGNADKLNLRYAWPSADWGSLPIEGGVQAAYRREIEAAADPDAKRRELEEALEQYRSPYRSAEAFGIEEVIDPRDSRPLLCDWVEMAYEIIPTQLGPKTRIARP